MSPNLPRMLHSARHRILQLGRRSGDTATALRFFIIAKLGSGHCVREVARQFGVAPAHVSRTQARFLSTGIEGMYDQRQYNGCRKVDEEFSKALRQLLLRSPPDYGWMRPSWTRELLGLEMERQGFAHVSVGTIGRALHDLGARLKRPKPIVLCPWPRARKEAVLKEIQDLEAHASAREPVLFADEVDIHKNPKIGLDWMLRGHQRRILTPGKNEKFYLAGALDIRTGLVHAVGDFTKNSSLFCALLTSLAQLYPRARRIHLILDNYVIHKSKMTEATLRKLGGRIVLHFLPPYCPDHNRIERVWQDLHANVTRNHRCKTLAALLANARAFIDAYRWLENKPPLLFQDAA